MSSTLKSNVVVVLDNGAGLCKAGIAGERDPQAVVPNCIGRLAHSATTENNNNNNNSNNNNNNNNNNKDNINSTSSSSSSSSSNKKWLIADQLVSCEDLTSVSIRRPYDRGYLINPDLQKEIWERLMSSVLRVDPCSSSLLLVQPLFSLPSINRSMYELVFEDLSFRSLFISNSPSLVHLYQSSLLTSNSNSNSNSTISTSTCTSTISSTFSRSQCSLVVDCGFSFCHAAPVLHNFTLNYAVRRLDLGGKALTNYLKELISFRSLNVMDETFLVDDIKEKLCFVSLDLPRHLHASRSSPPLPV